MDNPIPFVFSFLKDLCINNNRDWFDQNRNRYKEVKTHFEFFVSDLILEIEKFDSSIKGVTPKESIFRIFRDTRFSHDKTPYKTNMGAYIVPGGRKSMNAGYYFHLEPDNSFIAGGIYMPPSDKLLKIRERIFNETQAYKNIIYQPDFIKQFGKIDGDKLKANPRGFSKDFQDMELIKLKSYNVSVQLGDEAVQDANVLQYSLDIFKQMYAFNRFLNEAVM